MTFPSTEQKSLSSIDDLTIVAWKHVRYIPHSDDSPRVSTPNNPVEDEVSKFVDIVFHLDLPS